MKFSSLINMDSEMKDNALSVVVRTLKERCYLLQKRLKSVEEENVQLTLQCSKTVNNHVSQDVGALNATIAQLTKEKSQLAQHVFMVACENKKLWSRLLILTKSNLEEQVTDNIDRRQNIVTDVISPTKDNFTIPHLIRSQTFTQATPNPKLKPRIEENSDNIEASLEEISLKVISSFLAEKSELVQQYEQMVELQMTNEKDLNFKSIGFAYLDDLNSDALADIKRHTDKLIDLKKEVTQQQIDLRNFIARIESIREPDENLPTSNENKGPMDVDTSETEMLDTSTRWVTPANSTSYQDNMEDVSTYSHNTSKFSHNIQSLSNGRKIDDCQSLVVASKLKGNGSLDRICPLCGEHFKLSVSFEMFSQHVEQHFIGDEDYDSVAENYEVVVNSIGNNFN